jgi:hypothetical protein
MHAARRSLYRLSKVLPILSLCFAAATQAQDDAAARQVVIDAAAAMGGIARLESVSTLRLRGYVHEAYQDGQHSAMAPWRGTSP